MTPDRINIFYIIYAENYDNFRYYVSNLNPLIWNRDIINAKKYVSSRNAEYDVICDYVNYREFKRQLDSNNIRKIYIGEYDTYLNEIRRIDVL